MPKPVNCANASSASCCCALARSSGKSRLIAARVNASSGAFTDFRSEEHTSELQSLMRISYAVFCLKKKKKKKKKKLTHTNKQLYNTTNSTTQHKYYTVATDYLQ